MSQRVRRPAPAAAGLAVAGLLAALPEAVRINHQLRFWLERALVFVATLYFVNFMNGLDWMTVAEVVPVGAALGLLGHLAEAISISARLTTASA